MTWSLDYTDRGIVIRVVAEQGDGLTPVSDVMTTGLKSCLQDDGISEAARRMAGLKMRRLVVFDSNGNLSGFISMGMTSVTLEKISQDN